MAVAFTELTTAADDNDRTAYTTASCVLVAGRLYLVGVSADRSGGTPPAGVETTGSAVSFTLIDSAVSAPNSVSLWRAIPGSNVTATISISTPTTNTGCIWSVVEVTGMDASAGGAAAIVQHVPNFDTGNHATRTVTLPNNLVAGNARYIYAANNLFSTSLAISSGTWTQGTCRAHSAQNAAGRAAWNATPATTDKTAVITPASSSHSGGIFIEIAQASSGDTTFAGDIPI